MKTGKIQVIALCVSAILLCGCFKKEDTAEDNTAASSPSATTETTTVKKNHSGYLAEDFTLTVTDSSANGLKNPLESISVTDADGNTLSLTVSDTNQRTTYSCDDYSLSVSYSLMTDGVNDQTIVKYLIEVTDNTSSTSTLSSRIQEETFDYLADADWYEDGSAMVNKTETPTSLIDDEDREYDTDIDIDESELGTSTTDDTVCVCDECGRKFTTVTQWYQHVMDEHDGIASYHIETK